MHSFRQQTNCERGIRRVSDCFVWTGPWQWPTVEFFQALVLITRRMYWFLVTYTEGRNLSCERPLGM